MCDNIVCPVTPCDVGRVDVLDALHLHQVVVEGQEVLVPVPLDILLLPAHAATHIAVGGSTGDELQLVDDGVLLPVLGCGLELVDVDGGGGEGAPDPLLLGHQVLLQHLLILLLVSVENYEN